VILNYFISYTYFINKRREWGNCGVKTSGVISNIEKVAAIENQLRKSMKNKTLVITDFKRFEI